jgi:hypothetical protein
MRARAAFQHRNAGIPAFSSMDQVLRTENGRAQDALRFLALRAPRLPWMAEG